MQEIVSYTVHSFLLTWWGEREYNTKISNLCKIAEINLVHQAVSFEKKTTPLNI